jgi:hypothetical protein
MISYIYLIEHLVLRKILLINKNSTVASEEPLLLLQKQPLHSYSRSCCQTGAPTSRTVASIPETVTLILETVTQTSGTITQSP